MLALFIPMQSYDKTGQAMTGESINIMGYKAKAMVTEQIYSPAARDIALH